jgi:hypothetical protein
VNKLKDCQTIREAYIRLGLLKVKIIEVPLGEAEALKIRPGEKPKEPAPKPEPEKPKEPRKFFDENEKEITAAQFRNNCIKQINDWTLRDISALDLDLSHWSVENGSVMAPGDNSDRLDELCNSIWTKGTLKGDVAEVFTEKEYFQVKSRAVIFALFECLIKSNQTEALPI